MNFEILLTNRNINHKNKYSRKKYKLLLRAKITVIK